MRKSRRGYVLAALLFSFLCFPAGKVLAASNVAEVPLTVTQSFEQKSNEKEVDLTGDYELRALDAAFPMPEDSRNGKYLFVLSGDKTEKTISLRFAHGGVYRYQLVQTTKEKENYSYDRSSYTITVYIRNGENGELIPQVIAEKEDGKKYGKLEFKNSYGKSNANISKPSKPAGKVRTGDTANVTMCVVMASCALLLMIFLGYLKRHNQKGQ